MQNSSADTAKDAAQEANPSEWKDFGIFLLKLAAFMFILRSFIISPFNIPSESMQPRLLIGDYLLVTKWNYGYSRYSFPFSLPLLPSRVWADEPKRGDVAVFKAPPSQRDDYIKRVIGLPGDVIQMRNSKLEINGLAVKRERIENLVIPVTDNMLDAASSEGTNTACWKTSFEQNAKEGEKQCSYPQYRETLPDGRSYNILDLTISGPGDDTEAFVVPEGHLFLMGDNRDRSSDSRFPAQEGGAIGIVPQENLVGRAWMTVFSTDGSANWILPWTWFTAARWDRIGDGF